VPPFTRLLRPLGEFALNSISRARIERSRPYPDGFSVGVQNGLAFGRFDALGAGVGQDAFARLHRPQFIPRRLARPQTAGVPRGRYASGVEVCRDPGKRAASQVPGCCFVEDLLGFWVVGTGSRANRRAMTV
jgi:hypothetical protein